MDKLQAPKTVTKATPQADHSLALSLEHTPHTKSELRQQTALALSETDIVAHDMARLRTQHKIAKLHKMVCDSLRADES